MAQAPPELAGPNPDRKEDTKTYFSITDCPICLESLRKPKSLPCLHTFCQECLSIYITGTQIPGTVLTCFECPICRRQTLPTQPAAPSETWASHFPTNSFVLEVMKTLKPEDSTPQICHPCYDRKNVNVCASCWCQDCGFFLCETCHDGHNVVLYKHKVFSKEELPQDPMVLIPIQPTCTEHNEKLSLFCLNHDNLGCHMCIAIEHRRCDDVTSVTKYAESLRSKETCSKFNSDMVKTIEDIDEVISQFRHKLDVMTQDKDTALQRLSDARKWFDDQNSKLTEEVTKTYKDESEKMLKELLSIEAVRTSMLQTKAMKQTAQDENQLVTTVMRGKSEMSKCEEIIKNKDDKTVRINMQFTDEYGTMIRGHGGIGKINVMTRGLIKPMFGRKATSIGTISIPCKYRITGMLVLHNETLVVSDCNNKQLLLLRESGQLLDKASLDGTPWDLCLMPNGDIAAAVNGVDKISILRVSSSKLSLVKDIPLKVTPYGVTFYNGALHISSGLTLQRVSEDGSSEKLHILPSVSYIMATRKDGQLIGSLRATESYKTTIFQVSPDKFFPEVLKTDLLKFLHGVNVDDEDNIYVCDYESNKVIQISADGSMSRETITSNDVTGPSVVQVCGEKLYVGEYARKVVKIFKLV